MDLRIRTHGTPGYRSVKRGESNGCHRLHNYEALRLAAFLIRHHGNTRDGLVPEDYVRHLQYKGQDIALQSDSKGYRFALTPPVPVKVLDGDVGATPRPSSTWSRSPRSRSGDPSRVGAASTRRPWRGAGDTGRDGLDGWLIHLHRPAAAGPAQDDHARAPRTGVRAWIGKPPAKKKSSCPAGHTSVTVRPTTSGGGAGSSVRERRRAARGVGDVRAPVGGARAGVGPACARFDAARPLG